MNKRIPPLLILPLLLFSCLTYDKYEFLQSNEPFSFSDLRHYQTELGWPVQFQEMSDGIKIAYRFFGAESPEGTLVFYHGGGAHGGAGYIDFCRGLSERSRVNIYLVDLRGHGQSGGPRGDGPSRRRFLKDVSETLDSAESENPGLPLYLAGHSSGAGLILNYSSSRQADGRVGGYFFFSPYFGPESDTERVSDGEEFLGRERWPFIANRASLGLLYGHNPAVVFHYPRSQAELESPVIMQNSVNVARAVIPSRPASQLEDLNGRCALWVGSRDEVLDVKKLLWFFEENAPDSPIEVMEGYRHLSLMLCDGISLPLDRF